MRLISPRARVNAANIQIVSHLKVFLSFITPSCPFLCEIVTFYYPESVVLVGPHRCLAVLFLQKALYALPTAEALTMQKPHQRLTLTSIFVL